MSEVVVDAGACARRTHSPARPGRRLFLFLAVRCEGAGRGRGRLFIQPMHCFAIRTRRGVYSRAGYLAAAAGRQQQKQQLEEQQQQPSLHRKIKTQILGQPNPGTKGKKKSFRAHFETYSNTHFVAS